MQNLCAALFVSVIFLNNLKQKYINSAVLLLVASVIVKAISAVYKIPLTSYIGATGRGYFNTAYNMYMPVHAVIMGAFPVALTHLISKYREKKDAGKIYMLKRASNILFFAVGILGTVLMLFAAQPYSNIISSPKSVYAIYVMAPTVFFSAMAASKRAFAEGHMNMVPTSAGQVIEAVFKLVFGLLFAKYAMQALYSAYLDTGTVLGTVCNSEEEALSCIYPITSAAAIGGVAAGAFLCWIYCSAYVSVKYGSAYPRIKGRSAAPEIKKILTFSMPIILSSLIQSLSGFADNASIQYCLTLCDQSALREAYAECLRISSTPDSDAVTYIFGLFSSANDLKMLVPSFTMALGVAAVPAITCAYESGSSIYLSSLINSIFKYTSLFAFGGGFFISLTARYILEILYKNSNYDIVLGCTRLSEFYGFTMIFFCLTGAVVFSVQAIGCAAKSIPSFLVAAVIRVALNFLLVSDHRFNIYGAAISDIAGYAVILVSNLYILSKYANVKYTVSKMIVKPFICSIISYFASLYTYRALFHFESELLVFVTLSIIYTAIFTFLIIVSKTVELSELKILQHCKKMA